MTVVPEQALSLLTWGNLEHGVCGDRDISLAHLKGACKWRASLFGQKHQWVITDSFIDLDYSASSDTWQTCRKCIQSPLVLSDNAFIFIKFWLGSSIFQELK